MSGVAFGAQALGVLQGWDVGESSGRRRAGGACSRRQLARNVNSRKVLEKSQNELYSPVLPKEGNVSLCAVRWSARPFEWRSDRRFVVAERLCTRDHRWWSVAGR